jgi:hypothetical protein
VQATVAESLSLTIAPTVTSVRFMQSLDTECGSVTTCNLTFPSSITAGDILIIGVRIGTTGRTVTVNDNVNAGNYTQAATQVEAADHQGYIFYKENAAAGITQVTVTISGAAVSIRFNIQEYRGIAAANSLDATNSGQGVGGSLDSGNITTTQSSELLFGLATNFNGQPETWTPAQSGGTWNIRQQIAINGNHPLMSEDFFTATSGGTFTNNPQLSSGEGWTSLIAAFKTASCAADDGASITQIGTTAVSVPFGTISSNTFYQGCQDLTVSTNAGGGYSLTVQENHVMMTSNGTNTIPDTS